MIPNNKENSITSHDNLENNLPVNPSENTDSNQSNYTEKFQKVELEQHYGKPYDPAHIQQIQQQIADQKAQPHQPSQMDPVQQVKSMISAGYTPSLQLIQSAAQILKTSKSDDANLWFTVLFQKLIRGYKS